MNFSAGHQYASYAHNPDVLPLQDGASGMRVDSTTGGIGVNWTHESEDCLVALLVRHPHRRQGEPQPSILARP